MSLSGSMNFWTASTWVNSYDLLLTDKCMLAKAATNSFIFTISPMGIFSCVFPVSWLLSISVQVGTESAWPNPFCCQFWKQLSVFKYVHVLELQTSDLRLVLKDFIVISHILLPTQSCCFAQGESQTPLESRNSNPAEIPQSFLNVDAMLQLPILFSSGKKGGENSMSSDCLLHWNLAYGM